MELLAGASAERSPGAHDIGSDFRPHGMAVAWLDPQGQDAAVPKPDRLPADRRRLMRDIGQPSGLAEIGYTDADIDGIVSGTMQQSPTDQMSPIRSAVPITGGAG